MLAGQPTDGLDPTAGLAEGTFDEVRVPHRSPVPTREPQVHRQRSRSTSRHRTAARYRFAPTLFERIDPLLHVPDRVQTRLDRVGHVEDRPVVDFTCAWAFLGTLASTFRARCTRHRCRSAAPMVRSNRVRGPHSSTGATMRLRGPGMSHGPGLTMTGISRSAARARVQPGPPLNAKAARREARQTLSYGRRMTRASRTASPAMSTTYQRPELPYGAQPARPPPRRPPRNGRCPAGPRPPTWNCPGEDGAG